MMNPISYFRNRLEKHRLNTFYAQVQEAMLKLKNEGECVRIPLELASTPILKIAKTKKGFDFSYSYDGTTWSQLLPYNTEVYLNRASVIQGIPVTSMSSDDFVKFALGLDD